MANNYGPRIVTDSLVLCLDPVDINSYPGSGTSLLDMSGNNYDASFQGSPIYSNGSIVYNGSTDYLQIANTSDLQGSAEKTFSMWVKFDTLSVATAISLFCKRIGGAAGQVDYFIFVYTGSNNAFHFDYGYGTAGYRWNTGYVPATNTWMNIVFTRSTSKRQFFLNGSYVGETSDAGNVGATSSSLLIGRNTTSAAYYLDGNTGPIHIYNKELSASEILQNYEAIKNRYI